MKYMIPKIIHIFWNDLKHIPEVVKLLIQNIKLKNPDFKVILYGENDIPFPIYKKVMPQYLSDIFRLYILYVKGGVYLDASIICVQSITCAFDLNDPRLQGYEYPNGGLNMENYAMAVEKNNKFVLEWLKECLEVNKLGAKAYVKKNKKYVNPELQKQLPYLANFLAYSVASYHLFQKKVKENNYIKLNIKSIDENGPLYYFINHHKNSNKAVEYLLNAPKLLHQNCFIKLRGSERKILEEKIKQKKYNLNSFIIKQLLMK